MNFSLNKIVVFTLLFMFVLPSLITPLTPKKKAIIVLRFDDSSIDGVEIASKYKLPGTIFAVTRTLTKRLADFRQAQKLGWTIESHTHSHPRLTKLSSEQLIYELEEPQRLLRQYGFNGKVLAYPGSKFNGTVVEYVSRYYLYASRGGTIQNAIYEMPLAEKERYLIHTFVVFNATSIVEVKEAVDEAVAKQALLTFMFHRLRPENYTGSKQRYSWTPMKFELFCAYLRSQIDLGVLQVLPAHLAYQVAFED